MIRRDQRVERSREVQAAHSSTIMQADVIHVLHAGRVVESGTHAELAARGGRYAQSWRAQRREAGGGNGMGGGGALAEVDAHGPA